VDLVELPTVGEKLTIWLTVGEKLTIWLTFTVYE
jgi:hypothetical protein